MGMRLGLLVAMVLCFGPAGTAQVPAPGFAAKLPLQDLPPGQVHDLAIDAFGMLWIASDNGLCRYDGVNLELFRNVPGDSSSLNHNVVHCLLPLPDGRVWVGGLGSALFDPGTRRFKRIPLMADGGPVWTYECRDLGQDGQGGLWAASQRHGILRYDPGQMGLVTVGAIPETDDGRPLGNSNLCITEEGVWTTVGTSLALQKARTGAWEFFPLDPEGGHLPTGTLFIKLRQFEDDPDGLWIGTWGLGLLRFDRGTRTYEGPYLWQTGEPTLTNIVLDILPWGPSGLLLGTNEGIRHFDRDTRSFGPVIPVMENGLPARFTFVGALMRAKDGTVWAASSNGISVISSHTVTPIWLSLGNTLVLTPDLDGAGYWASRYYHDRGLLHLDSTGQVGRTWPLPNADEEKIEPFRLLHTPEGGLFIGTTRGLFRLRPGGRQVERMLQPGHRVGPTGKSYVIGLCRHLDGSVLISTVEEGTWRWDPATDSIGPLLDVPWSGGRAVNWGKAVIPLDRDHVLMTFDNVGIGVADLHVRATEVLDASDPRVPAIGDLAAVVNSGRDIYVVLRTNGILHLRWNGPGADTAFAVLGKAEMPGQHEVFNDAATGADGTIWIASSSGMVRFRPGSGSFTRWTPFDGFPLNNVETLTRDGPAQLIAKGQGFVRFQPEKVVLTEQSPGMYLRSLLVNGTEHVLPPTRSPDVIRLAHDQNMLTITYAPIDLLHADQLRFEVMLEGHDAGWTDNGAARSVSYVELPPGKYLFAARATGVEGAVARVAITIVPAFWQTAWFKALAWLCSALLVYAATRYVVRLHYKRRIAELEAEQEVQRTRMRIARDIHDGIGGGLTRIAMLSRRIQGQGPGEELAAQISSTSTELVRELGEIVWTVDPGNDSRSAFAAFVRNSLGRQFDQLEVELDLDLRLPKEEEALPVPPEVKRNALLILKEAVNNALKHAGADRVRVRLHLAGHQLQLEVEDNGKGFDPEERDGAGHGLANMRKRAQAAGGTLDMDARPGKGTTIRFRCPLTPTLM